MTGPAGSDAAGRSGPGAPGLARERTVLAWRRTAISFAAVAAAVLRSDPVAGALLFAMTLAVWMIPRLLYGQRRLSRWQLHRLVTSMTVLVSLIALVVAVFGIGRVTP